MSYKVTYIYFEDELAKAQRARDCLRRTLAAEPATVTLTRDREYGTVSVNVRVNKLRDYARIRDEVLPKAEKRCKL